MNYSTNNTETRAKSFSWKEKKQNLNLIVYIKTISTSIKNKGEIIKPKY